MWIVPFGTADMRGMLGRASKEQFIKFTLKIVETSLALMRLQTRTMGRAVTQARRCLVAQQLHRPVYLCVFLLFLYCP